MLVLISVYMYSFYLIFDLKCLITNVLKSELHISEVLFCQIYTVWFQWDYFSTSQSGLNSSRLCGITCCTVPVISNTNVCQKYYRNVPSIKHLENWICLCLPIYASYLPIHLFLQCCNKLRHVERVRKNPTLQPDLWVIWLSMQC